MLTFVIVQSQQYPFARELHDSLLSDQTTNASTLRDSQRAKIYLNLHEIKVNRLQKSCSTLCANEHRNQ